MTPFKEKGKETLQIKKISAGTFFI